MMKLLDRYIAKTILAAIALVTLMLAGLQIFILFVGQLGDLGKAHYDILQALMFVLLLVPYQVYLFFPMASLLGCLIGLGILANHRELVVMRASGMSIGQVTIAVLKAALVMIIVVTIVGETLVPQLSSISNNRKMEALSNEQTLRTSIGVWLRYHNDFITIGAITPENRLKLVYQFSFDETHHLRFARKIDHIDDVNGQWRAFGVSETDFYDEHTETRNVDEMNWDVTLKPNILNVSGHDPDEMTMQELYQYLHAEVKSQRIKVNYQLVFWQRMIQPLTTVVMMMLAIPFIFGPLRESTMGSKLLAGATAGFGFHIINQFFGPISQVYQWPVVIAAVGPTLVFALLGLYLMRRVR